MKRQIPGLHHESRNGDDILEGIFLVCVDRISYRWHLQRPFYVLQFVVLEPKEHKGRSLSGRLYCTPKALWRLSWFLRDFGYDTDLLGRDEVDEKAVVGLRGVLRTSRTVLNGRTFLNFDGFASVEDWEDLAVPVARIKESAHDL